MQIAMVLWVDSCATTEWHLKKASNYAPSDCTTVGIIVEEKKTHITLALNESPESWGDCMTIPRSAIKEIVRLKLPRKYCLRHE